MALKSVKQKNKRFKFKWCTNWLLNWHCSLKVVWTRLEGRKVTFQGCMTKCIVDKIQNTILSFQKRQCWFKTMQLDNTINADVSVILKTAHFKAGWFNYFRKLLSRTNALSFKKMSEWDNINNTTESVRQILWGFDFMKISVFQPAFNEQ